MDYIWARKEKFRSPNAANIVFSEIERGGLNQWFPTAGMRTAAETQIMQ